MDLNSARMFSQVAAKGSFSAAAKEMGVPVATLSRRVAQLESELDTRLLARSTRNLRLTEAGRVLYDYVARGVEEFDAGLLALSEQETLLKGRLRFSMPPSFEPMWDLLSQFQEQYPNIRLEIMTTERRVDFIEDGIDVALRVGELQSQSAVVRKLVDYHHKLVAAPSFLAEHPIHQPQDLMDVPCIAWGYPVGKAGWCLGDEMVSISPVLGVNDYMHIRTLVLKGKFVSELPPFLCAQWLARGDLVEVLADYPLPKRAVSLVYPSRLNLSRISRTFLDFCASHNPAAFTGD